MRTFRTIVIACITLAGLGCDIEWTGTRYVNVVRVFMHEPHRYTLLVQPPDSPEIQQYEFSVTRSGAFTHPKHGTLECGVHLRADVERGAPMWAMLDRWGGSDCRLTIHLHDPSDVEGGSWTQRRNKRTVHGTTQVVE